jgi:hypothetical protein
MIGFARQPALHRIRVGLIGLIAVLAFVSIASFVFDQAPSGGEGDTAAPGSQQSAAAAEISDEPLAELGVAPTVGQPKNEGVAAKGVKKKP